MKNPTVSVIIPTYNRADLVKEAVASVLAQTFADHEIVVIDDGSTDETREVLTPYMNRIRYFSQKNRGLAGARNRGIQEARGRNLAFLDSDDLFEPEMLEAVLRTFDRYVEAGAVFSAEREIDADGKRRDRVYTKKSPGPFFTPATMIDVDTRVGSGRPPVIRREWVDKLGGFDETIRCAVDCAMWTRYAFHVKMVIQPRPLVLRRIHLANISGNQFQDADDWLRILDDVAREHPEFVRANRRTYRRALSKQQMRYGRELMAVAPEDSESLLRAREMLRRGFATRPTVRGWLYVLWSVFAPRAFRRFRRWQVERARLPGTDPST